MQVTTTSNRVYSYFPRTNEIVLGKDVFDKRPMTFKPFVPFRSFPNLDSFILGITEQCNLRCSYCCYSGIYENNRTHSNISFGKDDVPNLIRFIDRYATKFPINISFYGGEPILHYELLQYIILQSESHWKNHVCFYLATNGTLMSKERIDWLVRHNVMIAISIDGTREFHDRYRTYSQKSGSFDQTYEALSYLKRVFPNYIKNNLLILSTITSFDDMALLAEAWHQDPILCDIAPTSISALAPNFKSGVVKREWDEIREKHENLLNLYTQHRDWLFLKSYFDECVRNWEKRPIFDVGEEVPLSTCMPISDKIFIDSHGGLYVCEKISNQFSIGNIISGIDWNIANNMASSFYNRRKARCINCPAIRMCSLCLTSIGFTEEQMDILCHNERLYTKINFWLFCEMAERGLIK